MVQISVVVPIYKAENYLPQCVDSILTQTFTDFELLLVDDGSPDRCGKICDAYAAKDNRVRVFHQENKGPSAARNLGLAEAVGKYITFVDADDMVAETYLEKLFSAAEAVDASQAICGVIFTWGTTAIPGGHYFGNAVIEQKDILDKIIDPLAFHEDKVQHQGLQYVYGRIYRKEIIDRFGLRFDESMRYAEDWLFNIDFYRYAQRVVFVEERLYEYCQRDGSLSKKYRPNRFEDEVKIGKLFRQWFPELYDEKNYHRFIINKYYICMRYAVKQKGLKELFPFLVRTWKSRDLRKAIQYQGFKGDLAAGLYFWSSPLILALMVLRNRLRKAAG